MKSRLGDKVRLQHILDAIELIEKALHDKTQADFQQDIILQAATERWVEIIGEATYKITSEFKKKYNDIEWKSIEGLRHVIVHEYFGLDLERIWLLHKWIYRNLKGKLKNL